MALPGMPVWKGHWAQVHPARRVPPLPVFFGLAFGSVEWQGVLSMFPTHPCLTCSGSVRIHLAPLTRCHQLRCVAVEGRTAGGAGSPPRVTAKLGGAAIPPVGGNIGYYVLTSK